MDLLDNINPFSNECSLFVGELTEDVDDLALFNAFKKYPTCRSAKGNYHCRSVFLLIIVINSCDDKWQVSWIRFCSFPH